MSNVIENNSDKSSKTYGRRAVLAQVLATLAQSFLLIGLGMELSIPTLVIHDLYQNPNSEFSLSLNQVSWYGSLLYIFHPTGSLLSGFLQERFGRKRCMIFANIPSIFGWILLYFTHSITFLYVSTIMMGLSVGFSEAPILSYVGEITEPRLRGSMASLSCMASMFGVLVTFMLGFLFDWRTVALLSTCCPVTCICLLFLIPESPVWLVNKGKIEKAEKALCWLRGWVKPEKIKAEHVELIHYNDVSGTQGGKVDIGDKTLLSKLSHFKDPSVYRPLRLLMIYFFVSNIISCVSWRQFFNKIMTDADILDGQSLLLVVFSVLQSIGCLIVVLIVHYTGKKSLTIFSFAMNITSIILFGVYIIAMKNNLISSTPWIPITILCNILFFGGFVITLPWLLMCEIFPNRSRGIATGSSAALVYLMIFVLTKSFIPIETCISLEYTMILFGCTGLVGLVYLCFYLPETENKTLLEIEEFFSQAMKFKVFTFNGL